MIERAAMQKIARDYGERISIGVFGSHSAIEVGLAARMAGLPTFLIVEKGREETYTIHNSHLFDDGQTLLVEKFADALSPENQEKMREAGVILIPNRSMFAYWKQEAIENKLEMPIYGNRWLLAAEERSLKPPRKNQYALLDAAGVRRPRRYNSPAEIDGPVIVKTQQKDRPLERAFFYATTPEDFVAEAELMVRRGLISPEIFSFDLCSPAILENVNDDWLAANARIEQYVIGPYVNANFHVYGMKDVFGSYDLLGFGDREQTNESGFRNLPARLQAKLEADPKFRRTNEEIAHRGKTLRESQHKEVYSIATKFFEAVRREVPPGIIGMCGLQGAIGTDENNKPALYVFDVSLRVPGDPAMGPTSPVTHGFGSLTIKHHRHLSRLGKPFGTRQINFPLDLTMMEIELVAHVRKLETLVT